MNIKLSDYPIAETAGFMSLHVLPDRVEDVWRWSVQLCDITLQRGTHKDKSIALLNAKQAARSWLMETIAKIDKINI